MGCGVLLGLYFVIKNVEQLTMKTVLDFMFIIIITVYGGAKLHNMGLLLI